MTESPLWRQSAASPNPHPVRQPGTNRGAAFVFLFLFVAAMWVSESADWLMNGIFDDDGVRPRRIDGLGGIILHPFLHGGWGHLIANSGPLLVLGGLIALSGLRAIVTVTALSWIGSGALIWLVGESNSIHIGASGIVFGYLFYVVLRGVFSRRPLHLLIGLLVIAYYGVGIFAGILPLQPGVSWEGHLGGALSGIFAARRSRSGSRR